MAEVELARLAEQKAASPQVKDFARQLVEDHTKADNELKGLAVNFNTTLPTEVDSKARSEMGKLSKLSGARFDHEFIKQAIDDHQSDIKAFEHEADNGGNQAIKTFASNTLPALREHLRMAQNLGSTAHR